jgi:hypothetical protein
MIAERRLDRVNIKKILFEAFSAAFTFLILNSIFDLSGNIFSAKALKLFIGSSSFYKSIILSLIIGIIIGLMDWRRLRKKMRQ